MDLTQSMPSLIKSNRGSRANIYSNPDECPRRLMCERCPSCVQIRNISECSNERTPLIPTSLTIVREARFYDKILIYFFIILLLFGTSVGTYLLILQHQEAIIEEFDYISSETWLKNNTAFENAPSLHTPISKILLLEVTTNCTSLTKNCFSYEEFFENKKEKLRVYDGKIQFNFYQNTDGKIFEGRGWSYQSDCGRKKGCDDLLTVALIEDANTFSTESRLQHLRAFLDYCVMVYALEPCYGILVRHSSNRDIQDMAFKLDEMNRKDGNCKYFS